MVEFQINEKDFVKVVWASSKKVGIGIASTKTSGPWRKVYCVAYYWPSK